MSEASTGERAGHDPEERRGILVIAHGSRDERWVQLIDDAVATVQTHMPVTVGYLELVEGRSIADGVRHMEKQGVQLLHVLPFFVCSGSTHLDEIRYALGLQEQPTQETDLDPIHPQLQIIWESPMDDHPYMVDILEERINSLSVRPEEEAVLLVVLGQDVEELLAPGLGLGLHVVGFSFRRDKFARDFQPFWENIHLGITQDRAYLKRLQALLHIAQGRQAGCRHRRGGEHHQLRVRSGREPHRRGSAAPGPATTAGRGTSSCTAPGPSPCGRWRTCERPGQSA
jgi:hypothetical protein